MTHSQLTELNRMIAVMEASKTQEVESCNRDDPDSWVYIEGRVMRWNWEACDYRVKPVEPIHITYFKGIDGYLHGPEKFFNAAGCDKKEFIELTPEIKSKLGL